MNINIDAGSKEGLYNLNIHELRKLGSQVGVKSPSSLNKENLVDAIFSIVVGEQKPYKQKDRRGRPQKATIEDVGSLKGYLKNDFGLMRVASGGLKYGGEAQNQIKTGTIVAKNGFLYVRKYPFIESEEDAIISKKLEKDYALREYDVLRYCLVSDEAQNKEVGQIITINNCPVSEFEILLNRLEKVENNGKAIKIGSQIAKEGQRIVLKAKTNLKSTQEAENLADILKEKYNVVCLCLEKESPVEKSHEDMFVGYATDNVMAGLALASRALDKAREYVCNLKNTVFVIDNLASLVKIYEANYKNNAEAFIKRLLNLAGHYSNGASLTIIALADLNANNLANYSEFIDKTI